MRNKINKARTKLGKVDNENKMLQERYFSIRIRRTPLKLSSLSSSNIISCVGVEGIVRVWRRRERRTLAWRDN